MTGKALSQSHLKHRTVISDSSRAVRVIAVGSPAEWRKQRKVLHEDGIAFLDFEEVTQEVLDALQPSTVFSPLLANNFDCIELAMLLHNLGYSGQYRAMATDLPKPDVIEREVRQLCPQLDFRITSSL